jgi:hypothetical protein
MSRRDDRLHRAQQAWLLAIGRRLKTEYDALARPLPPALAALLEQLEARAGDADPPVDGPAAR